MKIGLTGGIGSGKSTVARYLAQHGVTLIDTDAIARTLTAPGGLAMQALKEMFGAEFIDAAGGLDRRRMRKHVFSHPPARQALETVLHPLIEAQAQAQSTNNRHAVFQVFDVPLLVETGHWRYRVQRILVVDCEERLQIQRVAQRPGWSVEMAEAVIRQQALRAERRACADMVITNNLGLEKLEITLAAAMRQLHRWACGTIASHHP